MLTDLLQRVRAYRIAQLVEITDHYRRLVESLANGEDLTTEEIGITLDNAGKSEEQLADDVELLLKRRHWAEQIQASEDAEKALREADRQIEKITGEMNRELAKFTSKLDQARAAKVDAERAIAIRHQARENLSGSCVDPVVLGRESEISERLRKLVPVERELAVEIRRAERTVHNIEADRERAERAYREGFTPADRKAASERIENAKASQRNHTANLRRLRDQAAQIRQEIGDLQAEMHELANRRLAP